MHYSVRDVSYGCHLQHEDRVDNGVPGIAEFAGLEFAGLENDGLESDGVEQEETYILPTMK